MLRHAQKRTFLYNKVPQWEWRRRRDDELVVHAQFKVGN